VSRARRMLLGLCVALAGLVLRPSPCPAQTNFSQPLNVAVTTLAADHAIASGTLVVQQGTGAYFGTPSPT
jgi:hypothetical protein